MIVSYSENGTTENPEIASFWNRYKEENASLIGTAESIPELQELIGGRVGYYNRERRHSGVGYRSPVEFLNAEGRLPGVLIRN